MDDAVMFLGAGFSYVAGLPLTSQLFEMAEIPQGCSHTARRQYEEVQTAWRIWKARHPECTAEEWLLVLWESHDALLGTTFENAIRFAAARLVPVEMNKDQLYYYGITTSVECEVHRRFWQHFLSPKFGIRHVLTTNYDILAEQGMRHSYSKERTAPICHYGGLPWGQHVRKLVDITERRRTPSGLWESKAEVVMLGHEVCLYKLHGSLNWAREPHGRKVHDDLRAAFRVDPRKGQMLIVPPIPEKKRPDWLASVWEDGERALSQSGEWIVCGYSLPPYDHAIRAMLSRAANQVGHVRIWLLDPYSEDLRNRWRELGSSVREVVCLPGLPEALDSPVWETFAD